MTKDQVLKNLQGISAEANHQELAFELEAAIQYVERILQAKYTNGGNVVPKRGASRGCRRC